MVSDEMSRIRTVLKEELGSTYPLFLLRCLVKKKTILRGTGWEGRNDLEGKFVRRLSIAPIMFIGLRERFGQERSMDIMGRIIIPTGTEEQLDHLSYVDEDLEGLDRLRAFHKRMDDLGIGRFNTKEYLQNDGKVCHFKVTRCIFHDFFTAVGTPELTKLFCDVDLEVFSRGFPDLAFDRGGSWENTIGYGADHCEFIFRVPMDDQVNREV